MIGIYDAGDKTIGVKLSDELTKQDYEEFVSKIDQKIKQFGQIKLFLHMEHFKAVEPAALWEDLKFDIKHHNDFEQIAIVGDKKWVKWSARFSELFFDAQVEHFEADQIEEAWEWLGVRNKIRQF